MKLTDSWSFSIVKQKFIQQQTGRKKFGLEAKQEHFSEIAAERQGNTR